MRRFLLLVSLLTSSWAIAQAPGDDDNPLHSSSLVVTAAAPTKPHGTVDFIDPLPICPNNKIPVFDGRGGFTCKDKKHNTTSENAELIIKTHHRERRGIMCLTCLLHKCPNNKIRVPDGAGRFRCKDKTHHTSSDSAELANVRHRGRSDTVSQPLLKKISSKNLVRFPSGNFLPKNKVIKGIVSENGEISNILVRKRRGLACSTCSMAKCPSDKIPKLLPDGTYICQDKRHKREADFYSTNLLTKCPSDKILVRLLNGDFKCKDKIQKVITKDSGKLKNVHYSGRGVQAENKNLGPIGPLAKCPSDKEPIYLGNGVVICKDKKQRITRDSGKFNNIRHRVRRGINSIRPLYKCPYDKVSVYLGDSFWICKDKKHKPID